MTARCEGERHNEKEANKGRKGENERRKGQRGRQTGGWRDKTQGMGKLMTDTKGRENKVESERRTKMSESMKQKGANKGRKEEEIGGGEEVNRVKTRKEPARESDRDGDGEGEKADVTGEREKKQHIE